MIKFRRTGQKLSPSKQGEPVKPANCSSSSDKTSLGNDSSVSTAEVLVETHATLPTKQSKRKMVPGRTKSHKLMKSPGNTSYQANKYSTVRGVLLNVAGCSSLCSELSFPSIRGYNRFSTDFAG